MIYLLKVAEKRKNLLDELAIKYQTESDQHRESIKHRDEEHSSKVHELSTEIDQLNVSTYTYNKVSNKFHCIYYGGVL